MLDWRLLALSLLAAFLAYSTWGALRSGRLTFGFGGLSRDELPLVFFVMLLLQGALAVVVLLVVLGVLFGLLPGEE